MSLNPTRILGLGTVVIDWMVTVDQFPDPDTKVEADSSHMQVGGPVPTALVMLSRMGHRCTFQSQWGDDTQGMLIEDDLKRERIEFAESCRLPSSHTGSAQVWIDKATGGRTIVCHRVNPEASCFQLSEDQIASHDLLYLDGWPGEQAVEAAQKMREVGKTVFLDAGSPKDRTAELLNHVDCLNAPKRFLKLHFDDEDIERGGTRLQEMGIPFVTITDGAKGVWCFTGEETFHQPAFSIDAVDTTGAGDVFSAGLLHQFLTDESPKEVVKFASASAALKCERLGNRDALPYYNEVQRFLSAQ